MEAHFRNSKDKIRKVLPVFHEFCMLPETNIFRGLDENYSEHRLRINNKLERDGIYTPNLLDNVHFAINNDTSAISDCQLIEAVFKRLSGSLDLRNRYSLVSKIKQMLKCDNGDYIHYLGEFMFLASILESSYYELIAYDKIIDPNNKIRKDADFYLRHIPSSINLFFEIKNYHPNKTPNDAGVYIESKIIQEIQAKRLNEIRLQEEVVFVPIIWAETENIAFEFVKHYYKNVGENVKKEDIFGVSIFEPLIVARWTNDNPQEYTLQPVSNLHKLL